MYRSLLLPMCLFPALAFAQETSPRYSARVVTSITKSEAPAWRTWKGKDLMMNYPGNWSLDNSGTNGAMVVFLAPVDSTRRFREHVLVHTEQRPGHTMAGLADEHAQELRRANAEGLENQVDGDTQTLTYGIQLNGRPVRCKRTVVKHGDTVLTLTYVASPDRYEEELFQADAVLNSLQFLE
ncbi:MAG TPA: hypothetical protein VGE21_12790 [Flavobacteriales bacterium]